MTISLFQACQNTQANNVFFLFNQRLYPEVHELWGAMKNRTDNEWLALYQHTMLDGLTDMSPLLIKVADGNPGETLFWALNQAMSDVVHAGFIIETDWSLEELHQHWLQWIDVLKPNDEPLHLPVYFPLLFQRLWDVLDEKEKIRFKGKQYRLYTLIKNAEGECVLQPFSEFAGVETDHEPQAFIHYQFTQQSFDDYFYPERIEALVTGLYEKYYQESDQTLEWVREHFHEGLALAKQKYLSTDTIDQETFATYRFILGNRFYEHPEFARVHGANSLRDRIDRFADITRRVRDELQAYNDWS